MAVFEKLRLGNFYKIETKNVWWLRILIALEWNFMKVSPILLSLNWSIKFSVLEFFRIESGKDFVTHCHNYMQTNILNILGYGIALRYVCSSFYDLSFIYCKIRSLLSRIKCEKSWTLLVEKDHVELVSSKRLLTIIHKICFGLRFWPTLIEKAFLVTTLLSTSMAVTSLLC